MKSHKEAKSKALETLNRLGVGGSDPEGDHGTADNTLLEFLRETGNDDIAEAWQGACERCGFWYA